MRRDDLEELHYITPLSTIPSIMQRGILSNRRADKLPHDSIAMPEVQERRAKVTVPGGRKLHEYANLYFTARNPMLYKKRDLHENLCVLRVSPDVLDLPGVVVTDANAASDYVLFAAARAGMRIVNAELTFADYWTDSDYFQYCRKKSAKCAEVLVPDRVDPRHILGAYVSCEESLARFNGQTTKNPASINMHLFFR